MNLDQVRERAWHHFHLADKQTRSAAFWATTFRWGIPILSAIVTAATSGELDAFGIDFSDSAVWLALLLTIATIANTVARPAEGFRISARYANSFWVFIARLDAGIEEIRVQSSTAQQQVHDQLASAYTKDKIEELAKLVDGYNSGFLPAQPQPEDASKHP